MQERPAAAVQTLQGAHPVACTGAGWVTPLPSLLRHQLDALALAVVKRRVAGGWYGGCRRHYWLIVVGHEKGRGEHGRLGWWVGQE